MKWQIAKEIRGALTSAKAAHPEIDYADFTSSIVKRILGTHTLSNLVAVDEDLTRTMAELAKTT